MRARRWRRCTRTGCRESFGLFCLLFNYVFPAARMMVVCDHDYIYRSHCIRRGDFPMLCITSRSPTGQGAQTRWQIFKCAQGCHLNIAFDDIASLSPASSPC